MPIEIRDNSTGFLSYLSNLAHTPFPLDGVPCGSVEGVIRGLLEPKPARQREIFGSWGPEVHAAGSRRTPLVLPGPNFCWLDGVRLTGPDKYLGLVRRATMEKFRSHNCARLALLATWNESLVYKEPAASLRTSLPPDLFLDQLEASRNEVVAETVSGVHESIVVLEGVELFLQPEVRLTLFGAKLFGMIEDTIGFELLNPTTTPSPRFAQIARKAICRAVCGMVELTYADHPLCELFRGGGEKDGISRQAVLANDLVSTICAEMRALLAEHGGRG